MNNLQVISEILSHISWPLIVIFLAFMFKSGIQRLLERLGKVTLPGGAVVEFGKSQSDLRAKVEAEKIRTLTHVQKSNAPPVDNIYWLGHDLMLTIDALLRNAERKDILFGFNQSLFHLGRVHLWESNIGVKLRKMMNDAEKTTESDWTLHYREAVAKDLRDSIGELGRHFAEEVQLNE